MAPTASRIHPIVTSSTPLTETSTAHTKMAPAAMSKRLTPIPIVRSPFAGSAGRSPRSAGKTHNPAAKIRSVETLAELQERRRYECRLTPDRALETIEEAEDFLRDRGLLTRTPDCALPSLFEACHEEPYAADKPGFGQWPATKFPWFGRLGARGYLILAIHR